MYCLTCKLTAEHVIWLVHRICIDVLYRISLDSMHRYGVNTRIVAQNSIRCHTWVV